MGLISGRCPECGESLKISDKASGKLTCPYCGTEYLVEDAVTNIVNNVSNNVVNNTNIDTANINVNLNKDFIIKDGVLEKYIGESVDVVIPTTVKKIADHAFAKLKIETVKIPNSLTSIGDYAFSGCSNLESITIGDSLTSIGVWAFFGCRSLTSITIPDSVTSIGDEAFYNCISLTSIVVDENNSKYDSRNNCNAIIEKSTNTLILGCKNTTIPDSVTSIEVGAFLGCSNLTNITIPDSVTSIGEDAFYGCSSLTNITIPNSVTSLGENKFSGCWNLESINFKGTRDQWNAISKGSNWNTNTGSYTIYCTDGEIAKS